MVAKKKVEPITQEQVKEFIAAELNAVTFDTIDKGNLGYGLIESDLDIILCLKNEYKGEEYEKEEEDEETEYYPGEELTVEEKQDKVSQLLFEIQRIEEADLKALDRDILDFALQSKLNAEKAAKEKELKAQFSKGFAGLNLKDGVKDARKTLKDSTAYENAKVQLDKAMKARRERSKEKKVDRICNKVQKLAVDVEKNIKDEDTMSQLRSVLNKAFKVNSKKKTTKKVKATKTTTAEPTVEEVIPLVNPEVQEDELVRDIDKTIVEEHEAIDEVIEGKKRLTSWSQITDLAAIAKANKQKQEEAVPVRDTSV